MGFARRTCWPGGTHAARVSPWDARWAGWKDSRLYNGRIYSAMEAVFNSPERQGVGPESRQSPTHVDVAKPRVEVARLLQVEDSWDANIVTHTEAAWPHGR